MQDIAQMAVEATKGSIANHGWATGESNYVASSELMSLGPKLGGPTLKQPTFDWSITDQYMEFKNFRLKVNKIFKTYSINNSEKYQLSKTG